MSNHNVESQQAAPATVRRSTIAWFIAIGAGIFETALVALSALWGFRQQEGLVMGVLIRMIIFVVMSYVIVQMSRGKQWARITLLLALGILGTPSLLIGPIEWLWQHGGLAGAFTGWSIEEIIFAISRTIHIIAVWAGVILMFLPMSNRYFSQRVSG